MLIRDTNSYFQDFNYSLNSKYTNQELNSLRELFTSTIIQAANNSIPRAYKSIASKPWWNEELKSLRKSIQKYYRLNKSSEYILYNQELKEAKNLYFNTIKIKKKKALE